MAEIQLLTDREILVSLDSSLKAVASDVAETKALCKTFVTQKRCDEIHGRLAEQHGKDHPGLRKSLEFLGVAAVALGAIWGGWVWLISNTHPRTSSAAAPPATTVHDPDAQVQPLDAQVQPLEPQPVGKPKRLRRPSVP